MGSKQDVSQESQNNQNLHKSSNTEITEHNGKVDQSYKQMFLTMINVKGENMGNSNHKHQHTMANFPREFPKEFPKEYAASPQKSSSKAESSMYMVGPITKFNPGIYGQA